MSIPQKENPEKETLDDFLARMDWKSWDRTCMEWCGVIILTESDAFLFRLVIFFTADPGGPIGTDYLFEWDELRRVLSLRGKPLGNRPIKENDQLKLTDNNGTMLWPQMRFAELFSAELVEAFLDDRHRSEIFTAFLETHQRSSILRWLQNKGLAIYRRLKGPHESEVYQKATLPPKMDLSEA